MSESAAVPFPETLWSVVLRGQAPRGRTAALNRLCEQYWRPVYAYLLRKGREREDARDLTQGFFVHLLGSDLLARVDPARGRFRSYLLAVLEHFLANEARRARAAKRGGGIPPFPLDFAGCEARLHADGPETPEAHFQRRWALDLLARAFAGLRAELAKNDRGGDFELLRQHLLAAGPRRSYADLASALGCAEGEVGNRLHRARKSLKRRIEQELRATVSSAAELEEELGELFSAL